MNLLLAAAPLDLTLADNDGALPIHYASLTGRSGPFCKRLIDAYPESLRVQSGRSGCLPIHLACRGGINVETVKCLVELDPESIDARDRDWVGGNLPIHFAALSNGQHKVDIIRYLLAKDPDCASERGRNPDMTNNPCLPLHLASYRRCLDSVRLLFDAYPEAITIRDVRGDTPVDVARKRNRGNGIVMFLEAQLAYIRQAADIRAMRARDENGWLPLHRALRNNASLGAIKMLIKGNPCALQVAVNQLAFPLHIACEFSTVGAVEYLLKLLDIHLHTLDLQKDSTLHYACRGGNVGVVKYLSERHAPSVSKPNSNGKLPIHLLWESDRVDRNSVEYVDVVWRLLLARPETVMH